MLLLQREKQWIKKVLDELSLRIIQTNPIYFSYILLFATFELTPVSIYHSIKRNTEEAVLHASKELHKCHIVSVFYLSTMKQYFHKGIIPYSETVTWKTASLRKHNLTSSLLEAYSPCNCNHTLARRTTNF